MEQIIRPIEEEPVTGMPHTVKLTTSRIRSTRALRRALGLEAEKLAAPSVTLVHCHLCGSPHAARANHFCPRLYGR